MTYTVSGGTLNPTHSLTHLLVILHSYNATELAFGNNIQYVKLMSAKVEPMCIVRFFVIVFKVANIKFLKLFIVRAYLCLLQVQMTGLQFHHQ